MQLIAFLLAAAITAAAIPVVMEYASRRGLYDLPGPRKIHTGNVPRLGGVGMAFGFIATIAVFILMESSFVEGISRIGGSGATFLYWPILVSALVIHILGLADDLYNLPAILKFLVQTAAALLVILTGYRFRIVVVPWGGRILSLGMFSVPVTLLWIIGLMNAMNLIDGMDGLAGGIAFIGSATFGVFFTVRGQASAAALCFALAGSTAGFLAYNLPPARIFMGDSGSLFLGFALAVLPLLGQTEMGGEIGIISAATVFAIPTLDTLFAMFRRKRAGLSFFSPDRGHIHHRLLERGYGTRKSLLILYGICLALSGLTVWAAYLGTGWTSLSLKLAAISATALWFIRAGVARIGNRRG